jgi:hypothetical protein
VHYRNNANPCALADANTTPVRRHWAHWTTLLSVCFALCSLTIHAGAQTLIYLYVDGQPVYAASYVYQAGYVYDMANNLVGTVDANGRIYDANGYQIGFLAQGTD